MEVFKDIEQDIEKIAVEIGDWFKKDASAAEQVYDTLTTDEKQAATWAYGVLSIVNTNLSSDMATIVIPIIEKAYPSLDLQNLQGFIDTLLNQLKLAETPILTLVEGLQVLANYLKQITDKTTWGAITQTLGNILTIIISPETTIQKIASVAELIYQVIIKPSTLALAA